MPREDDNVENLYSAHANVGYIDTLLREITEHEEHDLQALSPADCSEIHQLTLKLEEILQAVRYDLEGPFDDEEEEW